MVMKVKAITRPGEDEPEQHDGARRNRRRVQTLARYLRRRFDARRSFKLRAAIASRFAPVEPHAHAAAADYLATTLDMINQLHDSNPGKEFGALSDYPQSLHFNHGRLSA